MNEMLPLYVLAACSVIIAIFTFVSFVLLVSIWRGLKRRDRARGEAHMALRSRIHRIEDFLISHGFRRQIPDPKIQIARDARA